MSSIILLSLINSTLCDNSFLPDTRTPQLLMKAVQCLVRIRSQHLTPKTLPLIELVELPVQTF